MLKILEIDVHSTILVGNFNDAMSAVRGGIYDRFNAYAAPPT